MAKILVVEDDKELLFAVENWLVLQDYLVETVANGADAADRLKFYQYDLLVLDWELPDGSGIEILASYRASGGQMPVLMLTGKGTITDKETGFDAGADDYLTKPFNMRELSARVKALLRRPGTTGGDLLKAGDLSVDPVSHKVMRGQSEIHLHPKEFALLEFFLRHPQQVFSPEALIDHVWSSYSDASPDSIRAYITKLRAKIGDKNKESIIRTVHGVGYRFEPPA